MNILTTLSKVALSSTLVIGGTAAISSIQQPKDQVIEAKAHTKTFSAKRYNHTKGKLPSKIHYTRVVWDGKQKIKYYGYLPKKSVVKQHGKYVATYKGTLKGKVLYTR